MTAGWVLPVAVALSEGKAVQKIRTENTLRCTSGARKIPISDFGLMIEKKKRPRNKLRC